MSTEERAQEERRRHRTHGLTSLHFFSCHPSPFLAVSHFFELIVTIDEHFPAFLGTKLSLQILMCLIFSAFVYKSQNSYNFTIAPILKP